MRRVALLMSFTFVSLAACTEPDDKTDSALEFGDEQDASEGADTSGEGGGTTSTTGMNDSTSDATTSDATTSDATTNDSTTSTTTGETDTGNPENPYDAAAQHCVDTINMYRATLDLPPYERWTEAEVCSGEEAQSDAMTQTPHGAFGQCGEWAQNECPGWPGPPEQLLDGCLAQMWAEGPGEPFSEHGHYINMSSTQYTKVACGFYQTAQGDYWAIQNFQ